MNKAFTRIKKRKKAKEILNSICEQQSNHLIIHYSCESFFDIPEGRTPRVTSIAVKYFDSGQTKSFSIHKIAEVKGVEFKLIETRYDELEKIMLSEFYQFVGDHKRCNWIHLNMRNISYGFEAIAHRFSVLGGKPTHIDDNSKIDLGRLLVDLYGNNYIEHPHVESLCHKNNITMTQFLTGAQEAIAFKEGEYVKLHQSTLRKVENLQTIIDMANEGDLKTNNNLLKLYGLSPQSIFQIIQENWIVALFVFIFTILLSAVVSSLIK